jgi:hypothetical protein
VIDKSSAPKIYPLTFVKEKSDIMVGRPDIDSFALFPPDGVALLRQMQAGLSPEQAVQWYEEQYNDTVDIDDFLDTLQQLGFIREEDEGDESGSGTATAEQGEILFTSRTVSWQWLGRAAFSPVAWILYLALFGYCIYDIVRYPILFPVYTNIFFSRSYTLVVIGVFFGQFPGLLFHEGYHMLAGRRIGLPSRLSLGHRFYYVVFETVLNGVWSVPPRYRYLPFLAGMLADCIWFSLLTILAGATLRSPNSFSFFGAVCAALAFETVLRFIWQFYFYLRTDLYYIFTNIFGCIDLHHTTNRYLWNFILRIFRRTAKISDETLWNPRDRQLARVYAPLYIVGYALTIYLSLSIGLPILIQFLTGVFGNLITGFSNLTVGFWDSAIFLAMSLLQSVILGIIIWREYKERILSFFPRRFKRAVS